jgi:uncharacterized delta-60 repeat protein
LIKNLKKYIMKQSIFTFLLSFFVLFSNAQLGTLDASFGENGRVINDKMEGYGNSMTIQGDGKIVVGGVDYEQNAFMILRYNPDGTLDYSFGINGKATNDLGEDLATKIIYAVALQTDGKIVAAGQYAKSGDDSRIAVMRFNKDGSIDSEFGEGGITITSIGQYYDIVHGMSIMEDGRIVVTGDTQRGINDNNRSFVACYTNQGQLDENFGNKGIVIITLIDASDITSIQITKNSKILIGGYYKFLDRAILLSYNDNGTIDLEFGNKGIAEMKFGTEIFQVTINDISLLSNNAIIVSGYVGVNGKFTSIVVGKFDSKGKTDSSFGNNGYSIATKIDGPIYGKALASLNDGEIIVAGASSGVNTAYFTGTYFRANGEIDSIIGNSGTTYNEFENFYSGANDVSIQVDGKIIMLGYSTRQIPDLHNFISLIRFNDEKSNQPKYVRIKHWLHHHGITWEDKPNNLINYYSIQSSTNGNAFTEVARIFSNHNGGTQTYTASSNATANYRVAAVSNTGNITYSNTLTLNTTPTIQLYPNPAKNILQIQGLPAGSTKLTVTDISGNTRLIATANSTVYSINIAQLTSGNYLLHIKTANEVITKQFIKE